jgi:hypothetical protein
LIPPIGQIPSSINLTQDFQITWQPDPNANIMDISIAPPSDSGQVNCTLPDANGSVTVAASLFAAFPPGDGGVGVMGVSLVRAAQRDARHAPSRSPVSRHADRSFRGIVITRFAGSDHLFRAS